MADFRIPPAIHPGLKALAHAEDAAVLELARLLDHSPEVLVSRQAAHAVAKKLTGFAADQAQLATESAVALIYFKSAHGRSTGDMLTDIRPSLEEFTPQEFERLDRHLSRLLELPNLAARAKAISVAADCPRLFSEVRVVSDLRPIFGDRVTEPPVGAVVMHNLRINFAEEGEEREFFVHLDTRDLKTLQEHIARALDKDKSLRAMIERTKLQIFETS